ncbi:unnamed protein product [Prorocentrum cordatum]|uniref:Uncharacterized protein n=1 Tax=Prorocentrum cordatum TaxID=2364126 RepID=A0ABN9VFR5_9DINO|nr:unnamed protein product [Polarella glacialis]
MWTRLRPARATRPRGAQHVTTASDTGGLLDRRQPTRPPQSIRRPKFRVGCRRAVGRAAPRGASACARARVRRPRPRLERARPATSNERYQRRRRRTRRRRTRKRGRGGGEPARARVRASEAAPWANAPGDKQTNVPPEEEEEKEEEEEDEEEEEEEKKEKESLRVRACGIRGRALGERARR